MGVLIAIAGREGDVEAIEGEGLRRRLGAGTGNAGDLRLEDNSDSMYPSCGVDGNVFRGGSRFVSLPSGLGVYERLCGLGVEGVERSLRAWGRGDDCLFGNVDPTLEGDGLDGPAYLCKLGPGPDGVLIVRSRMCSRISRSLGDGEGLGEPSDSIFST